MNIHQSMQMAVKFANGRNFAEAEKILRGILATNNQFHPAIHMLGQLAFQSGRDDIAAKLFHQAATIDPKNAGYHRDFAETLFFMGHYKDTLMAINRSIQINQNDPKAHFIAGNGLMHMGENEQAIKAFKHTIKMDPNHSFAHNNLGSVYEKEDKLKEAKNHYELAMKVDQSNVLAINNLATLLTAEGDLDKAKKLLNQIIKTKPDYIEAHHNLSALKRYKEGDEHIAILLSLLESVEQIPLDNKYRLYFILGKVHADLKDYDKAFEFYELGNNLKRSTFEYYEDRFIENVEKIKAIYSKENIGKEKVTKSNKPVPIFVVGMPRSGSTLVEQILASHSEIFGAGELTILSEYVNEIIQNYPEDIEKLSDQELQKIGGKYLDKISAFDPNAKYIVDKNPGNFLYAGLIKKILPEALIINTNRNAMDCCVSNYTHLFLDTIHYTNDLGELGRYFNIYSDLMAHWRSVLPNEMLYDISYEDVVDNLEQEAKSLIEFTGLDWEESCLEFHKKKSNVKTASAAQVRKPIYKSSVERWRVYEEHLGPLISALKDKE